MSFKPVSYLQTDGKWKNFHYSTAAENTDLGKPGCGPTAAAMVAAEWADSEETPLTAAQWSLDNGYKATGQGTYYSFFEPYFKRFGLKCERPNSTNIYHSPGAAAHLAAYNAVKQGDYVIACMGVGRWTSSGHFILWYGIDGDNVLINDPNSTAANRLKASWNYFKNQVKYYFIVRKPSRLPEPVKTDNYTVTDPDGYLNVRYGAGTSYGVMGQYLAGTVVPVEKTSGGWARFVHEGTRLYVCLSGLTKGAAAKITAADKALEVLASKGVINTPNYWNKHMNDVAYLSELLVNMANTKTVAEKQKYASAQQAINAMAEAGVINSPGYWLANYQRVEYLETLLVRFANMMG